MGLHFASVLFLLSGLCPVFLSEQDVPAASGQVEHAPLPPSDHPPIVFPERPVSWQKLLPNLARDQKDIWFWKPGAVVNVGIRSGTSAFHGSAYAFGRNGPWDARSVFNPSPQPLLPVELEQFGGVIGGPVKKDKLFFFAGYEGLRS